jgi:hypothetical protein
MVHYLDTNAYRRIFREKLRLPVQKKVALSYVSLLELFDQFQRATANNFAEIKGAIGLARKHCRSMFFTYPSDYLRKHLLKKTISNGKLDRDLKKAMDMVLTVRCHSDVLSPIHYKGAIYQMADIVKGRQQKEQQWAASLTGLRDELSSLASAPPPTSGGPITGSETRIIAEYYTGTKAPETFSKQFPIWLLKREGIESPPPELVSDVSEHLEASAVFLGEILRAMMVDGYRAENKANDCGDYSQLQYLCVHDNVFVTDDEPLRKRICSAKQSSRVIPLNEFLK